MKTRKISKAVQRRKQWSRLARRKSYIPKNRLVVEPLEQRVLLSTAVWEPMGPSPTENGQVEGLGGQNNPVVGSIHTVAAHPSDPDTLYVGAANGGIWKTTDATATNPTWSPLTDFETSLSIGALEFDPADSQTLVAGLGTFSSFGRTGGSRDGLLMTADGGDNWTAINDPSIAGQNISGVAVRSNIILASANDFNFNGGVFRSIDTGGTFVSVSTGAPNELPVGAVADLVGDPGNPTRFYAAVLPTFNQAGGAITTQGGLFRSDDSGLTWTNVTDVSMSAAINTASTQATNGSWNGVNNIEIAVHDNSGGGTNAIYTGVILRGQANGFFRSPDQGASWAAMDIPQTNEGGNVVGLQPREKPGGQGGIHFSIVADPTDANIVYVGGDRQSTPFPNSVGANDFSGRLFRGDASVAPTGGVPSPQWTSLTHSGTSGNSSPHADSREMVFDANGNIIETDDGGIYRRTNPSSTSGDWFSLNSDLRVTEFHDIAWDSNSDIIIGGAQDTGTPQQTSTGSFTWTDVQKADGGDVAVDAISLGGGLSIRYSSIQNFSLFVAEVYDNTNTQVGPTVSPTLTTTGGGTPLVTGTGGNMQFVTPLELNVIDPMRLLIGGANSLYESTDQGATVQEIATIGVNANGINGNAMAYGGTLGGVGDEDILYVGSGSQIFTRTVAAGAVTATAAQPAGAGTIRDIELDPTDWQTAYVIDGSSVYQTTTAGGGWSDITGNLLGASLRSISLIPAIGFNAIVVGTMDGVFATATSLLGQWIELGDTMPNVPVWDMDFHAGDDILLAGSLGRGAWSVSNVSQTLLGEVHGAVWADTNGDGIQDGSEPGLSGIRVELRDAGDDSLVDFMDTDVSGDYFFEVIPETYYVEFVEPVEHSLSPQDEGGDDTVDSDPDRLTHKTASFSVLVDNIISDIDAGMIVPDRFEQNDTFGTAADLGVLPGVHINDLTISDPGDDDYFRLELLRPDYVDISISFTQAFGDLNLQLLDDLGGVIATSATASGTENILDESLAAGTYFVRVYSDDPGATGDVNVYDIAMDPGASSTTRMIYVNDGDLTNDFYTQAVGNNANDGLTHLTPKATLQNVLDTYILGITDLVLIDTGTYTANAVLTKNDESAAYGGTPVGSTFAASGTNLDVVDSDFNIFYELAFSGSTGIYAHSDGVDPSTDNEFRSSTFSGNTTGIRIDDGERDVFRDNIILAGSSYGVRLERGQDIIIQNNTITGRANAVYINDTLSPIVDSNNLTTGTRGVYILSSTSNADIKDNTISGFSGQGILIQGGSSTTQVRGNDVSLSGIGIESQTSVIMSILNNDVHDNTVGIKSYGVIGAADWSSGLENDVYDNTTGIWVRSGAEVRFNLVHGNDTGIYVPEDTVTLHHNVVYRNTTQGILLDDGDTVSITNNTLYSTTGDGIRLSNFSSAVTLRNNIVWMTGGYDLYVDTNSQVGFDSDYNNFFTSGVGTVVWWQKDFADLFDWQVEADYDNHSIGFTSLHTTLDDPNFVSLGGDNYHLTDATSTSIDAGDPLTILANEPVADGARVNLGAYGNTTEAALSTITYIAIDHPNYYTDWSLSTPDVILWHSFGLAGDVDIDLYQEGVGKIDDIGIVPLADGSFSWTPTDSSLTGSITNRYYIRLTSVPSPAVVEDSRENFSVPPDTNDYYINDLVSDITDEYTTVVGDNRNTGTAPNDPKANLLPLLTNYDLGPADTIHIDTGDYIHVRNVILSGGVGLGNDEGATYTGPTDPAKIARIDRANPYAGSTNIDITDGDFVTLENLTLVGAERGLWVHNGSTNFDGSFLTFIDNALDGLLMDSDAEASTVDQLVAYDNGRDGIVILTPVTSVSNSEVYNNGRYGIYVATPSAGVSTTVISDNKVYDNTSYGIYAYGDNSNAITVQNNEVYNNSNFGIYGIESTLITLNTVYDHTVTNIGGIFLQSGATAHQNVVHGNYNGIVGQYSTSNIITNNTVYNNTLYGIATYNGSTIDGNKVYSNSIGIQTVVWQGFSGSVDNNLVYDNSTHGIVIPRATTGSTVNNNTIFQQNGDALHIHDSSQNIQVRNNILWATSVTGHGLYVANDSQAGLSTDYNLFLTIDPITTLDSGNTGFWQGASRKTLVDWQNASFTDSNSLSRDPLVDPIFVNPDGGDGFGYVDPVNDGRNDDFHLQSQHGRFTSGLTPVRNAGTGLPEMLVVVELTDANQSPAIDRGDAALAYVNELAPNGGFINIGAYGNTSQASKSPLEYVLVLKPDGGETWPADQTFPIRWRSDIMTTIGLDPGLATTYAADVLTNSPVGYWKLNDVGATAVDSSVNGLDGSYVNGVIQSVSGFLIGDDASEFDGSNDHILVSHDPLLNPAAITVEAWIRPNSGIGTNDSVLMKSSSGSWDDGYGLYYDGSGNIVFYVNGWSVANVKAPVALDEWQHVAATYSVADSNLRLYINGAEVDTFAYSAQINHSVTAMQIGQGRGSNSYTWKGRLDDVAVYDAALTLDDIENHMIASLGTGYEIDIELIRDGDAGFNFLIADNTLNDGEFLWTIDGLDAPPNTDYRVEITRTDNVVLTDTSDDPFEITPPISIYYVNDTTTVLAGDWTTAVGDAANDGLSPATPKDSIRGIIEQYDLGPGDVIQVDTGDYLVTNNIIVTAADMGITIEGYHDIANPNRHAVLDRANIAQDVFEILTDDITLSYLYITGGRDGVHAVDADNLTLEYSRVYGNARYGIELDVSSEGGIIQHNVFDGINRFQDYGVVARGIGVGIDDNVAFSHSQDGFHVTGDSAIVNDNRAYLNASEGLYVYGSSGATITLNHAYANDAHGIYAYDSFSASQVTVTGNLSHDNLGNGFYINTNVLATNNTAYGHVGSGDVGIYVVSGATIDSNTAYDNYYGIFGQYSTSNIITNNTSYNNSTTGISAYNGSTISGNESYSNSVGIQIFKWQHFTGSVDHNLVYDNATDGIVINGGAAGGAIENNTVYQAFGDTLKILDSAQNLLVRNNILWVDSGYAINVANNSQTGFDSDYNLFYLTGAGSLGLWEGVTFADRVDWFYELGLDGNSLVGDPDFVEIVGADGILGYTTTPIGGPTVIDDDDPGFSLTGTWTSIALDGGLNDDYERSDNAVFADDVANWTFSGLATGTYEVMVTWKAVPSGTFINATNVPYEILDGPVGSDVITFKRFNQRTAPNDFNDGVTDWENLATVVITGSELTVRLSDDANGYVVADAVRIQQITADTGADDDFHLLSGSLGIDNGDLSYSYANEPAPNGERVNIGRYGNTVDATLSPSELVQVLTPNGLEKFEHNQQITITWRTVNLATTIDIELVDALSLVATPIISGLADSGTYDWTIPGSVTPEKDYLIRVTAVAAPTSDDSNAPFVITNDGTEFYVNDNALLAGDWTTAVGDNAKSGKTPENPMSSLRALLAAYELNPGDVVKVDNGTYQVIKNITVDTTDDGFLLEGYHDGAFPTRKAVLDRANILQDAIEIFSDNVTFSYLNITGGRDGVHAVDADNLTLEYSRVYGNTRYGIELDVNSSGGIIQHNVFDGTQRFQDYGVVARGVGVGIDDNIAFNHSQDGFHVTGDSATINDNTAYINGSEGFYVYGSSGATITLNHAYANNTHGIYAYDSFSASQVTVTGNLSHDNLGYGFYINTNVLATGNTAYGHVGSNDIGIYVVSGATIDSNTVYDNFYGIFGQYSTSNIITNNTAYNNSSTGISAYNGSTISGNESYSNSIGIQIFKWQSFTGSVDHNLVYDNANQGIVINRGGTGGRVANNTVFQDVGNALLVQDISANLQIRNNTLWSSNGYAINVDGDSQIGFDSDYNVFHTTGLALLGSWQSNDFTDLSEWFYETGSDGNSLVADPLFVDIDGVDNVLGYNEAPVGLAEIIDDEDTGYALTGVWTSIDLAGGLNDDYDRNAAGVGDESATWTFDSLVSGGTYQVMATWKEIPSGTFINASNAPYEILDGPVGSDVIAYKRFNQRTAPNDFNDGSTNWENLFTVVVSGTELTVQISDDANGYVIADAVRIQQIEGDKSGDDNFHLQSGSLAIDAGDPIDPFVNEPGPNGDRINVGVYGNTLTATMSPAELIQVLSPNGMERFELGQNVIIDWHSFGLPGTTVDIDLVDGGVPVFSIATGATDTGTFNWLIPGSITTETEYAIRVTATTGTTPTDDSNALFVIANNGTDYYINDGTVTDVNDWTTAVGDNANSGKTPDYPMASLNALVAAYDLDAGDTIWIDDGNYVLLNTVILPIEDSGVAIAGYNDLAFPARKADLDRANVLRHVFEVFADNMNFSYLEFTGGWDGVHAVDADDLTLDHSRIYGNTRYGIELDVNSQNGIITNNDFDGVARLQDYGIVARASVVTIDSNTSYDHSQDGIHVTGDNAIINNNTAYINASEGLYVYGSSGAMITFNHLYSNSGYGLYAYDSFGASQVTVTDNISHDNISYGMYLNSNVLATENTVYGQDNTNNLGIFLVSGATSDGNTVYSNYNGIVTQYSTSNTVINNVVYNNTNAGVSVYNGSLVSSNKIYSNSIGIQTLVWQSFIGTIENNLIYANTNQGIIVNRAGSGASVVNNTIFQEVGDALRVQDSSVNLEVHNNILWLEAGYAINVDNNSQTGFDSDRNIFLVGVDINAHLGLWNLTDYDTLAAWQGPSGGDTDSLETDPLFVDPNGADDILGYSTVGPGFNGGGDDNFLLSASSLAIDNADSFAAPIVDIDGNPRFDDLSTPNTGTDDYVESNLGSNPFLTGGVAQNWRSTNANWNLALPFTFNFYGVDYTNVYVTANGFLQFGSNSGANDDTNSIGELLAPRPRIAALWDNLQTNYSGDPGNNDDIYVDTAVPNQVTIRWDATNQADSSDVNFAVTLFDTGHIRFDYGDGNTNLTPTVGISSGDGSHAEIATHNTATILTDADTLELTLPFGFADIGAYEFLGNSADTDPPTVVTITPGAIPLGGITNLTGGLLQIDFSEAINPIDAIAVANYDLRNPGLNGTYDNGDDIVYTIQNIIYAGGTTLVTLNFDPNALVSGEHRLTISGDTSIHDLAGLRLDGDDDSFEGGDYVRIFNIDVEEPTLDSWVVTTDTGIDPNDKIASDDTPELTLNFSKNVFGSNGDVVIVDPILGPVIPASITGWGSSSLVITLNALALDGEYTVTLDASMIQDSATNLLNGGTDEVLNFTLDQVAPQVSLVTINSGDLQRSNVTHVDIEFDEAMNLGDLISAGTIDDYVKLYDGFDLVTPLAWLDETYFSWDGGSNKLTIDLTVDSFGGSDLTNLPDGSYEIQIDVTNVEDLAGNDLVDDDGTVDSRLDIDRSTGAGIYDFFRMLADADGNRKVDNDDYNIWLANYDPLGLTANDPGQGDFDLDGNIGGLDLLIWQRQFNDTGLPEPPSAQSSLPPVVIEVDPDLIAPTVLSVQINDGQAQRSTIQDVSVQFSEDVQLDYSALDLFNETTGARVDLSSLGNVIFNYDTKSFTASWDLTEAINDDGIISARILASGVSDPAGNMLDDTGDQIAGDDYSFAFHRLLADRTGDGKVNRKDYRIWQSNYDPFGFNVNSVGMGDWNIDGIIDEMDQAIWKDNKGHRLRGLDEIDGLLLGL